MTELETVETSFTVEVLGFPRGADPEALAESVSSFFGISLEEGRRLVQKAPIRVKRNASADVTRDLVKQLRKLGADVLVRNEQTGEERTYSLSNARRPSLDLAPAQVEAAADEPHAAEAEQADGAPPEETLESDDGDAPAEKAPRVEVIAPPAYTEGDEASALREEAGAPGEEADAASETTAVSRADGRSSVPSRPAAPLSLPPPSGPGSLPPPASPILGVPAHSPSKLDFCSACKGPIDKGETCPRCGWNNAEKHRRCRQCKRKLSIVSKVSRSHAAMGLVALAGIAAGAGMLLVLGPAAGAAAFVVFVALGFVADGFTLRYACKSCTVGVVTERLQKEEEGRLRKARTKSLAVAALCGVAAGGLVAITGLSAQVLSDASYGIAWTLPVPRLNGRIGTDVVTIKVPTGTKRVRMIYAERPYIGGPTYFLTHVQYTHPARPVERDRAGIEAAVRQVIEVYFGGTVTGNLEEAGDTLQASFTGSFHGKPIYGHLRGAQHDHDMLVVAVTSATRADVDAPGNRDVLNGITVQRDPM